MADVTHERVVHVGEQRKLKSPLRLGQHEDDTLLSPVNLIEPQAPDVGRSQAIASSQQKYGDVAFAQRGGPVHARQ